jgi:addiction module HigA family antidote
LRKVGVLGRELRVPVNRISAIVNGRRGITADTALRLAQYFGNSAQYWMNLQALYDLEAWTPQNGKKLNATCAA